MKTFLIVGSNNVVTGSGFCQNEVTPSVPLGSYAVLDVMGSPGYDYYDIEAHVCRKLPAKPTDHHIFDYATKLWVDPRTPETEWPIVRAERDRRLLASDWTQLPDVPLATKEAWAVYRQALRDITEQPDPFNITWPVVPG